MSINYNYFIALTIKIERKIAIAQHYKMVVQTNIHTCRIKTTKYLQLTHWQRDWTMDVTGGGEADWGSWLRVTFFTGSRRGTDEQSRAQAGPRLAPAPSGPELQCSEHRKFVSWPGQERQASNINTVYLCCNFTHQHSYQNVSFFFPYWASTECLSLCVTVWMWPICLLSPT